MKPELFSTLEANGIYQQISQNLRETHNFAALYKVESLLEGQQYDLVILDTPPSDQVVDFFESPRRLQKFFSARTPQEKEGWVQWVQEKGVRVAEGFLKTLVGGDFVDEMDHFFKVIGDLRTKIHSVSTSFDRSVRSESAKLVLVFPPALDKVSDAEFLTSELAENQIVVDGYVLNRAYPLGLDFGNELDIPEDSFEYRLYNYFRRQKSLSTQLLQDFRSRRQPSQASFSIIPELDNPMDSSEDVLRFALAVQDHWQSLGKS